ncbi:MAG: hypothetical protein KF830_05670 [Planctomycetes bacterium]|nr:hypothetical protein [Planctomycetota bacterium]
MRIAGWTPWALLIGWSAYATVQEPAVLRSSGLHLREPAIWAAAAVLWIVLAWPDSHAPSPPRASSRLAQHSLLLLLVGLAAAVLLAVAGWITEAAVGWTRLGTSAAWWWAALVPLAAARSVRQDRTQTHTNTILMVISAGPSLAIFSAVGSPTAGHPRLLVASILSILASCLWMIRLDRPATRPATRIEA